MSGTLSPSVSISIGGSQAELSAAFVTAGVVA